LSAVLALLAANFMKADWQPEQLNFGAKAECNVAASCKIIK